MVGCSLLLNEPEIIFPEITALTIGAWLAPKQVWKTSSLKLVVLIMIYAIIGVCLVRYLHMSLTFKVMLAFLLCNLGLIISHTTFAPLISACILPILMHTESWIYPISATIMAFMIVVIQNFLQKKGDCHPYHYEPVQLIDHTMNQSIEFLSDGLRYYRFDGFISNLRYFWAVIFGKDDQLMHFYRYDEIAEVMIEPKKRYMKIGSPIAYEIYVPDFSFTFTDQQNFYFYWPLTLDDDMRFIATILEDKVKNIKDEDHLLYALKNGIQLNDYLSEK